MANVRESGEEYPVRTFTVAGSVDPHEADARGIARAVAEAVERATGVEGSTITYGEGRWHGVHEDGFTVTVSVDTGSGEYAYAPARAGKRVVAGAREVMESTGYTFYVTARDEVAVEVF